MSEFLVSTTRLDYSLDRVSPWSNRMNIYAEPVIRGAMTSELDSQRDTYGR